VEFSNELFVPFDSSTAGVAQPAVFDSQLTAGHPFFSLRFIVRRMVPYVGKD
jgi:hypothetical protein